MNRTVIFVAAVVVIAAGAAVPNSVTAQSPRDAAKTRFTDGVFADRFNRSLELKVTYSLQR